MPTVSILLPARNAEKTLAEALASVRAQSLTDFEVVLVDDGSTDGTRAIAERCAAEDGRIRVVDGRGRGLVDALNLGLSSCRASFIARFDADDVMHPDRLALQVASLSADPSLAAIGSRVRCFPEDSIRDGLRRYEAFLNDGLSHDDIARHRFIEAPLVHPSVTFRRSALDAVGGWHDPPWAEDWDLWMRLVEAGHRLAKRPEVLHAWRDHPARLTRTDPRYSLDAMTQLRAYYISRGPLLGRVAVVWGAGPVGKALVKALDARDVRVRAYVDVDWRKVGQRVHGRPVLDGRNWSREAGDVLLAAVGAAGAREEIREAARSAGFVEGHDFWCCA